MVNASPSACLSQRRRSPEAQIWRADLLLALGQDLHPDDRDVVAGVCGFVRRPESPERGESVVSVTKAVAGPLPAPLVEPRKREPGRLTFFQPVEYRRFDPHPVREIPPEIGDRPIEIEQLRGGPYRLKPEPLQSWSRLWPHLHRILGQMVPGRRIELARLVDDMAALRPVRSLPRRHHPAWAPRVHIHIDGTAPMDQFQPDVEVLLERLRRVRGREGLHCRLLPFGPEALQDAVDIDTWEIGPPPSIEPGEPLLALSDLGCLDGDGRRVSAWLRYGLHLRQGWSVSLHALAPCPRDRWTLPVTSIWKCSAWDRHERPLPGGRGQSPTAPRTDPGARQGMLEALLRVCSVAARIESALLRELRLLLPGADIGLEYDLWNHPETCATPTAFALRIEHTPGRLDQLARADDPFTAILKQALPALLRRYHRPHSGALRALEILNCRFAGLSVTEEDVAEASAVRRDCNRARLEEYLSTGESAAMQDRYGLGGFNRRELARLRGHELPRAGEPQLAAACALEDHIRGGSGTYTERSGEEAYLRTIRYLLGTPDLEQCWRVRLYGSLLELSAPVPQKPAPGQGVPLRLVLRTPQVVIDLQHEGGTQRIPLILTGAPTHTFSLENARTVRLRTDCSELQIHAQEPPSWVTRFGWDEFGLFADFEVKGVVFPLRWIPPGTFLMGSPEEEPGRGEAEGPLHRVTIGRGFWLGATPVTQGQYAAVTGRRPSYFKKAGDLAPVEQVSWKDCQEFCRAIRKKVDDLDEELIFRLPSEAEWEYACRAGANTALYTGPLTIRGENDGPELDDIAWYGGNSGVDYEGGHDSSSWPEKQHKHSRAGTHPVGQKPQRNPWGLHDMLGNVYEWCEDTWHSSYEGAPSDGGAWVDEEKGENRVYRGGSWISFARNCRCAYRYRDWDPGFRNHDLGFRLVLAPRSTEAGKQAEPSAAARAGPKHGVRARRSRAGTRPGGGTQPGTDKG